MIAHPETTARIEEIESTITWMNIFRRHSPVEQKTLLMELHAFGDISDDKFQALLTLLNLSVE